jgi:hypothetical protein
LFDAMAIRCGLEPLAGQAASGVMERMSCLILGGLLIFLLHGGLDAESQAGMEGQ